MSQRIEIFTSVNPATGDVVWEGPQAAEKEIQFAVQQAKEAFFSWAALPFEERAFFLKQFALELKNAKEVLAKTISIETGKPLWDSLNEVDSMINKVDLSIEAYVERCPQKMMPMENSERFIRHKPHGVVAVLGPYNFPGHLPNGHIVPALLAGNTVVFKPSELTPLVAEVTMGIWGQTDLPKGVVNVVQGGQSTGQLLINHPDIKGLFFTGSLNAGLQFSKTFASHPEKILALEMGGNNPLVVGTIENIETAVNFIILSAYLSSGQRCTCARRLILQENEKNQELITRLIQSIHSMKIGAYNEQPEPFMGPVITKKHAKEIVEKHNHLIALGGKPLLTMRQLKEKTGFISPGLIDVTLIRDRPDEEIFGPLLQLIKVSSYEEALKEANRTKYGLSAALLSDDRNEYQTFYQEIEAGVINWNTPTTGASSASPFGGIKCSGNFHPSAFYAADYCSYPVASIEAPKLQSPTQLPPGL